MSENKDPIKELSDMIRGLLIEVNSLKSEIEELRSKGTNYSNENSGTVLHTVKKIEEVSDRESLELRKRSEEMLEQAANYAIQDYRLNPPKNRTPG